MHIFKVSGRLRKLNMATIDKCWVADTVWSYIMEVEEQYVWKENSFYSCVEGFIRPLWQFFIQISGVD